MRRPIKTHLVNRSNRLVNLSNRPVYRSKPVTHAILNLDLYSNRSNQPVNRSNRPVYRYEPVELSFLNSNFNSTGFRPNRTGIPVPDPGGLAGPVGKWNPAYEEEVSLLLKIFRWVCLWNHMPDMCLSLLFYFSNVNNTLATHEPMHCSCNSTWCDMWNSFWVKQCIRMEVSYNHPEFLSAYLHIGSDVL